MVIRLIPSPTGGRRWGANQMRQRVGDREHFRRGNAKTILIVAAHSRAAAVQRWLPMPDPLAKASARHRSSVATLTPTSRDTCSTEELSGGNSRATIRSLYACPYRATF